MQIQTCKDYQEMSILAADQVQEELKLTPGLLFCAATGSSPEGLYEAWVVRHKTQPGLFDKMRIIKLDEWCGVPDNHSVTCEHFIRKRLLEPLAIPEDRYFGFPSDPMEPDDECQTIRTTVAKEGPIDLCILGLGQNGHLGFNEPGDFLEPFCHVAGLTEKSLEHEMIASLDIKPRFGISLGLQEILYSKKIILLVSGGGKKGILARLMKGQISTQLPASLLWTHGNVSCLIDQSVQD